MADVRDVHVDLTSLLLRPVAEGYPAWRRPNARDDPERKVLSCHS
jgi:hypothetical protein